nr:hypothetical protein [uncultured Pseudomonas sp.]
MESPNFFAPMFVAISVIVGTLIALPILVTRLTQPRWALVKSAIEFLVVAIFLSLLISVFFGVPIAFALAMFRHRSRVSRYAASSPNLDDANLNSSESAPAQIKHGQQ